MPTSSIPNPAATSPAPVWRDVALALLAAALCYALSCAIQAPGPEALTFGAQWQSMSEAPFELRGQFPQRILGPLLAHCLGLGGPNFVMYARGLAVLLLAMVCFYCLRRRAAAVDALLITFAIAVTAAIQMYKVHWVGFVDPLAYTLFFGSLLASRRPFVFWALFLANLTNHELAAFLLPWLWFVRRQTDGNWRADVLGAGLALAAYGTFYLWVKAAAPVQKYNADYFFANPMFPGGTFVIVALAVTHWIVAFGPVLAVLAWHQHTRAHGRERAHLWLVVAGILAIFCIAWDWSRHSNLIVLPLVLASLRFLEAGHRASYAALVGLGVALMLWIPPWSTSAWPTSAMANLDLLGRTGAAVSNPVTGEPMGGPLGRVLGEWLPEVLPVLSVILLIAAAIWAAGALFARLRKSPAAPVR